MAKNLKLNIKNAQLAEALKLNLPKKKVSSGKKDKSDEAESSASPSSDQVKELKAPKSAAPKTAETSPALVEKKPEIADPVKKEPATEEKPVETGAQTPSLGVKRELPKPKPAEEPSAPKKPSIHSFIKRATPSTQRPGSQDRRTGPQTPYQARPSSPNQYQRSGPGSQGAPPRRPSSFSAAARPLAPIDPSELKESAHRKIPDANFAKKTTTTRDVRPAKKTPQDRSFDSRDKQGLRSFDDEKWRKKRIIKSKQQRMEEVVRPKALTIRLPILLKDLASEMKLKASQLIEKLFMQGVIITLNDYLDDETTVQLLGHEFECEITIDTSEEERIRVTDKTVKEEIAETEANLLVSRPPVITFMGHVDHGKTSLIDRIRKTSVASTEKGEITQHIGAFKCHTAVGDLTILDTPGHEAFSAMRERGADVTDIVVLVIAGDEGVKTQTIEAIEQARKANVALVIALNKSDKPNFNPENIYRQLADQNLLPEAWGGEVITTNCSAETGSGVPELLEMLALQAEVLELKANPTARARGRVVESEMHKGLGTVATILVQNGTLKQGDSLVFDQFYAKVKTMHNEHDKVLLEAPPSTPVKITGLSGFPEAGSEFIVVKDEKEAKEISEKRNEGLQRTQLQQKKKSSLESLLQDTANSSGVKTVNLILKADVQGSLEALKTSLRKVVSKKVTLNFVSEGVGEISESDIQFAATSKATILGFHTAVESHAESLIKQTKVSIKLHDIIYHAVDDVKELMLESLDKVAREDTTGEAVVRAVFKSSQLGNIAGCQVSTGTIQRSQHARLVRGGEVLWKGPIASIKREKEDVREVQKGYECGILLQGFSDFKQDDVIQAYEITYLQQEL